MKPFLIDIPVLLFVFARPDTLEEVFKVIRNARPSKLFLVSDGPRQNSDTDVLNISKSRAVVENIDWDCDVHRLYFDTNQGMYVTFKNAMDYVFEREDRCIFLEDDVVTSISFFSYCEELLEKYKDDLRINMICGMNHLGYYEGPTADYFFTRGGSIWGFALWKRTYELFYDFSYGNDGYSLKLLKECSKQYTEFQKSLEGYLEDENFGGHLAGPEFYFALTLYSQNQLNIVPTKNMVKNIGYGPGNTHFLDDLKKLPKSFQKMFNMEFYEVNTPLRHPKYVIEDRNYEKILYKLMGRPIYSRIFRKIEMSIRLLIYGDIKTLFKKSKTWILRKVRYR